MNFDFEIGKISSATHKGELWELVVTPHDGQAEGVASRLPFAIVNAPPTAPEVRLSLTEPTVSDPVTAIVTRAASDKDDDPLAYRTRWFRDGVLQGALGQDHNTLAPQVARRGEHWRVEVTAFDGEVEGPAAVAEMQVRNHAPGAPAVVLLPERPRTGDVLRCTQTAPGTDPDGDTLHYVTQWFLGDTQVDLDPNMAELAPRQTHKDERWSCAQAAHDGREASPWARSPAVTVVNTPPSLPAVAVQPAMPRAQDDLMCAVATPAFDDDGDPLTYRFVWTVDGKPWAPPDDPTGDPHRVSHAHTRRGQNWECTATASDGTAPSAAGHAVATIMNTPPGAPLVAIAPEQPLTGESLRCEIATGAPDLDGDRVSYRFVWSKDGVPQDFAPTSAEVPGRLVKERDLWSCTATALDHASVGSAATSQEVVVSAKPLGP